MGWPLLSSRWWLGDEYGNWHWHDPYPQPNHLLDAVWWAMALASLKWVADRTLFAVLSRRFVRPPQQLNPPPSPHPLAEPILENIYARIRQQECKQAVQGAALSVRNREQPVRQAQQQILAACGVEMTSSELQRWLETRRVYDLAEGTHAKFSMRQLSLYARFQEALWQCLYFTVAVCFGVYVLRDKAWSHSPRQIFRGWPHSVDPGTEMYYKLSLGYYLHALATLCVLERRRRDFTEFFLHHIATLVLLTASWLTSFHRVGALILLTHDISDPLLHAAKAANYAAKAAGHEESQHHTLCDSLFAAFAVVFGVSRLYWYPCFLVYPALTMTIDGYVKPFPLLNVFWMLLLGLCLLHWYWMFIIVRILWRFVQDPAATGTDTDTTGTETE